MNVIDEVAEPHRTVLVAVLQDRAPDLLAELRSVAVPTYRQWDAVSDAMIRAMVEHLLPSDEPDDIGKDIDNALGGFYLRWPNDAVADPLPTRAPERLSQRGSQ